MPSRPGFASLPVANTTNSVARVSPDSSVKYDLVDALDEIDAAVANVTKPAADPNLTHQIGEIGAIDSSRDKAKRRGIGDSSERTTTPQPLQ